MRKALLESERWLTLKDNADRLAYVWFLLNVDDYGNYSGERYRLMRAWRDFGITTIELVSKTLTELQDHDMIGLYDVDGRPFVHLQRLFNTKQWWWRSFPKSPFSDDKDNQSKQRPSEISIKPVLDQHKPGVRGKGLGEDQNPSARKRSAPATDAEVEVRRKTWSAYSMAYEFRHGAAPVRDAKANSAIKSFCKSLPALECAAVAQFYVQNSNSFYVSKMHPPTLLAADAAKLRTEWATGRQTTQTEAILADKTAARKNVFQPLIDEAKRNAKSNS